MKSKLVIKHQIQNLTKKTLVVNAKLAQDFDALTQKHN